MADGAGLLDGRPATSHRPGLIGLRRDHPAVRWQDGVRSVDDGDVITTTGVLSGVDGALRVVERVVGEAAPIPRSRPAPADVVGLLSAGYRRDRPSTAVLLTEGVGEVEPAPAFRPCTEPSRLARPVAVTVDGQPVRSRHGLTSAPRGEPITAAAVGAVVLVVRLLRRRRRAPVPGAAAPRPSPARGGPR